MLFFENMLMLLCQEKANHPSNILSHSEKRKVCFYVNFLGRMFTENTGLLHENTGVLSFKQI